jgi:hypothetical protein
MKYGERVAQSVAQNARWIAAAKLLIKFFEAVEGFLCQKAARDIAT